MRLYQLQEWLDDLNALLMNKFGKSLRVASFLYDADGTLVELLNHSATLEHDVKMDGWELWDGQGFVQQ